MGVGKHFLKYTLNNKHMLTVDSKTPCNCLLWDINNDKEFYRFISNFLNTRFNMKKTSNFLNRFARTFRAFMTVVPNKFPAKTMADILEPFITSLNIHINTLVVSLNPIKGPLVVSLSKKFYSNCLVLVGSRNGFQA